MSESSPIRFRTEIDFSKENLNLHHGVQFFTIGSCFADQIGERLNENKFSVCINPFGNVYDPLSIFRLLSYTIDDQRPSPEDYIERDGLIYCDELHSSFNDSEKQKLQNQIDQCFIKSRNALLSSDVLLITFGTAWSYSRMDSGKSVANCHKLPSSNFEKKLLSDDSICSAFEQLQEKLLNIRPKIKIILTVSPVRHTRDSLEGNAVSKAILRVACHKLISNSFIAYFPAYEIMMDDLRDYRFYEADLIHPNQQAIDYIWFHFKKSYFSMPTQGLLVKWDKIRKSLEHKSFNQKSNTYHAFLNDLLTEIKSIGNQLDIESEQKAIEKRIDEIEL